LSRGFWKKVELFFEPENQTTLPRWSAGVVEVLLNGEMGLYVVRA
jgi:hypothetical protein